MRIFELGRRGRRSVVAVGCLLAFLVSCQAGSTEEGTSRDTEGSRTAGLSITPPEDSARVVRVLLDSLKLQEPDLPVQVTTFVADPEGYLIRVRSLSHGASILAWVYRSGEVILLRGRRS